MKKVLIFLLLLLMVVGCAKRRIPSPESEKMPPVEETVKVEEAGVAEEAEEVKKIDEVPQKVEEEEVTIVEPQEIEEPSMIKPAEEPKEPEEKAISAGEGEGIFRDIHFDYDRYDIRDEDKPTLRAIADFMIDKPYARLVIEGHCDERGTSEYNLGLGDRRANSAKDYLVSIGVSPGRMLSVSYGEEKPLCNEHNEECWWKNRRVHFELTEMEQSR
jgi:peptidoglycan-associated lipoprotein